MDNPRTWRFGVSYAVRLESTRNVFAPANRALATAMPSEGGRPARALVAVDAGVLAADPGLVGRIHTWFAHQPAERLQLASEPLVVDGGEAAKHGLAVVERFARLALDVGLCRHSYVVAIGGGAVLDAIGLAAALFHRGVRLVRLPTTVLAQDDAGLGVKNAVNAFQTKNLLGTFAPPWAIINDERFLELLDDRTHRAGYAEAVKVATIRDARFLAWIHDHANDLATRQPAAVRHLVQRCAELHLDHIADAGDPFEQGSSRPLDYGHWSAHRLEVLSGHRLNHGEAVAIGVALDSCYAAAIGRLDREEAELVLAALEGVGFRLHDPVLDLRQANGQRCVLAGLEQFREHLGGALTLAMPDGLGHQRDIHAVDHDLIEACCRQLAERDSVRQAIGAHGERSPGSQPGPRRVPE